MAESRKRAGLRRESSVPVRTLAARVNSFPPDFVLNLPFSLQRNLAISTGGATRRWLRSRLVRERHLRFRLCRFRAVAQSARLRCVSFCLISAGEECRGFAPELWAAVPGRA